MNEALAVYLNLDMENIEKNEEIIRKIDELLLTVGMKYSGIMNLYISVDEQKRDETVFRAEELLRNTDWLKDILSHILIGVITNACPIEEIQIDMMSNPSSEKWVYYEQYYQKTKQLPHAIVVDENKQLRDGYVSYLLAKKYGVQAEVDWYQDSHWGKLLREDMWYCLMGNGKRRAINAIYGFTL